VDFSRYAAKLLIVALSLEHSDIIRFSPWSPITTGNQLDRAKQKKFQNLLRQLAPLTFLIHIQAFRDTLHVELLHVQIFMTDPTQSLS
jgi:hypothetical protein